MVLEPATSRIGVSCPALSATISQKTGEDKSEIHQLYMLKNCQCYAAQAAPNSNRHNFACNSLDKAPLFINYAF